MGGGLAGGGGGGVCLGGGWEATDSLVTEPREVVRVKFSLGLAAAGAVAPAGAVLAAVTPDAAEADAVIPAGRHFSWRRKALHC